MFQFASQIETRVLRTIEIEKDGYKYASIFLRLFLFLPCSLLTRKKASQISL